MTDDDRIPPPSDADIRRCHASESEVARLRLALAAARREGAEEMREKAAKACRERADLLNRLGWDHAIQNTYTNAELQAERRNEALACEAAIQGVTTS